MTFNLYQFQCGFVIITVDLHTNYEINASINFKFAIIMFRIWPELPSNDLDLCLFQQGFWAHHVESNHKKNVLIEMSYSYKHCHTNTRRTSWLHNFRLPSARNQNRGLIDFWGIWLVYQSINIIQVCLIYRLMTCGPIQSYHMNENHSVWIIL